MTSDTKKLANTFVTCGMDEERAMDMATDLYDRNSKVMFRAILWAFLTFGACATYDTGLISEVMANGKNGELSPFQAEAKIVYTMKNYRSLQGLKNKTERTSEQE